MPQLPALIIAVILTAYWGRVVRLIYKTRKQAGHAANFAPPEPIGRLLRCLWVPVVLFWIAHPYLAAATPIQRLPWTMRPIYLSIPVSWCAAAIAGLAMTGTLVCWKRMGNSWRMGIDPAEKTRLIVTGPYAYVRHPIYALSSALMLATVLAVASPIMILIGATHLLLLQWEARREEKHLLAHHGQAYLTYCQNVPRFLPRLVPPRSPR
jgi:protein-S-isoprenylcysteine O-methyltransferase Ste14